MNWNFFKRREDPAPQAGLAMRPIPDGNRDPSDPDFFTLGAPFSSHDVSTTVAAAYAAINLLTYQMSLLQPVVRDAENEPIPKHPVSALLRYPSRTIDPWQFWNMVLRAYFTHGNAYVWIRRDFSGRAVELVPAWCTDARFVEARFAPYIRYRLDLLGAWSSGGHAVSRQIEANARDVIVFHGPGFDGLSSQSPVRYAADSILKLMRGVVAHQSALTKGLLSSGSALQVDPEAIKGTSESQIKQFQTILQLIDESMKQAKEKDWIPVLPPGVTIERMQTLSNTDLQLIDLLKWGVEDMARVFGVPPARLGHYYRGFRQQDVEQRGAEFERFSISPHTGMTDSQLTRKLVNGEDMQRGYTVVTPTDSLKRGSLTERSMVAKAMVADGGTWTINEGRELTDKPPIEGGDKLLQPKGAPPQDGGNKETDDE